MSIVVTGATGVLGAHVVRLLREQSERLVGISSRADPRLLGELQNELELEACDIRDAARVAALLARVRPQVVIHLAALMPAVCAADPVRAVAVNVTATAALYAAAAAAGVERFVYASSKSAYGPDLPPEYGPPEYRPIPETQPARPRWVYDITKHTGELLIEAQHAAGGPEPTSLRFATIYGPGKGDRFGGAAVLSRLIEHALQGKDFQLEHGGDQVDDLIWVGDAAAGVVAAARHGDRVSSLYNIATGTGITIKGFAKEVAGACPGARIVVGPGLHYMGQEPTYGVLDATRARAELGFSADPDPVRGVRCFARALAR